MYTQCVSAVEFTHCAIPSHLYLLTHAIITKGCINFINILFTSSELVSTTLFLLESNLLASSSSPLIETVNFDSRINKCIIIHAFIVN